MRILYWGMQRALGGALLWVGLGGAAVLLVDGVERSRLLVEGQNLGVWGMDLLHRLPVLLREIVPLLIVVGVVWSQAVSRNRGELSWRVYMGRDTEGDWELSWRVNMGWDTEGDWELSWRVYMGWDTEG